MLILTSERGINFGCFNDNLTPLYTCLDWEEAFIDRLAFAQWALCVDLAFPYTTLCYKEPDVKVMEP